MEASRVFNDLIYKIEKSQLNYKISKTPFSANVSIKSSFVKYQCVKEDNLLLELSKYSEKDVKPNLHEVKLENAMRKLQEEKENLENILKKEKDKNKSLEAEIGEFRTEILRNKKEKKTANSSLETFKSELDDLKEEKIQTEKATADLKEQKKAKKEVLKIKDEEYTDLKSHSARLEIQLNECMTELESAQVCGVEEIYNKDEIKCEHCDFKCESPVQLGPHVRSEHFKNQVSQTKNLKTDREISFTTYSCFYCSKVIKSVTDLEEHKTVCYTIKDFAPFPCSLCGAQCPEEADLGRHRTTYHGQGTFNEELGIEIFWCDVCPLTCRSKVQLDFHIRGCHEEF